VWEDEAALWLDEQVGVFAGLKPDAAELDASIVVSNYARLATTLAARQWAGVIFDESQALRNRNTRTLFKLVRHAFDDRRQPLSSVPAYFLSGTPIVKAAGDLWPILHMIDKRAYSSFWRFVEKYAITWHDQWGWHTEGITNAKALREEVQEVALWRFIKDVQPSLPPKVRQRIPLVMTTRQAKAYRELERDMYTELDEGRGMILAPSVLALETRLRQVLACPRILGIEDDGAGLASLVGVARDSNRPFVVFSPFAEALPFAEAALVKGSGRPVYTVRGGMGRRFREGVDLFKAAARASEAPILLATVQMGKSWSVSEVTHECYMLGFDWNDTTMHQAESRLHRDGQTDTVFARYLVHEKTHDLDALDVLAGKKRLADVILVRRKGWAH
jgi:SWI/SNF-related matrix-associated actin-dependent regulator 1 of chromatin subfamily A